MATGTTFAAVTETRLFGTADFRDRLLGHLRGLVQESFEKSFRGGCVYDSALALISGGNDAVTVSGSSEATDGQGHVLDVALGGYTTALQFQNTAAVEYDVALAYAEVPSGVQINPRSGQPEFIGYDETVGESGTPDLVTDNGGTITFRVNTITESGVSNAGRKVRVWKNTPGPNATTAALAVEELTVSWTGSQNEITTAGMLGQDTVSTTAADYTVVLMGPSIKRNTSLFDSDGYAFLGRVTGGGAGSPPSAYNTSDQDVVDMSLSDLQDITSRNGATDRLKIDVKSYTGDVGDPQIQVRNPAGTPVFTVDGDGNVTISGTTTQEDFVQVNSSETITDNLTAGDDDATDSHKIKGNWWHTDNAETAYHVYVDGATGRIGIGKQHDTTGTWPLDIQNATRINAKLQLAAANIDLEFRETSEAVDAGGLWRFDLNNGNFTLRENTAAAGDWSSSSLWFQSDRTNSALEVYKHLWPSADDALDLGVSGQQWRDLWIDRVAYIDTLSMSAVAGEGVDTDLVPTGNGMKDFGSTSYRWKYLYGNFVDLVRNEDNVSSGTIFAVRRATTIDSDTLPVISLDARTDATLLDGFGGAIRFRTDDVTVGRLNWRRDVADDQADLAFRLRDATNAMRDQLVIHWDDFVECRDLLPITDSAYDLGSASRAWQNVYVDNLNVGEDINPSADITYDLGQPAIRWHNVYTENVSGGADPLNLLGEVTFSQTASEGVASNVLPAVDGTLSLGTSGREWDALWLEKLYLSTNSNEGCVSNFYPFSNGNLTLGGASSRYWGNVYSFKLTLASTGGNGVASHLHPTANGTYSLGSNSYRWANLYVQDSDFYYSNNVIANSGFDLKRHSTTQTTNPLTVARLYAQTDATMGDGFGGQVNFYQDNWPVAYLFWTRAFSDDQTVLEFRLNNAVDSIVPQLTLQYNDVAKVRNLVPYTDEEYYLGSSSLKWKELHLSDTSGEGVGGTLAPMADDSYDLGTSVRQWRNLYLDGTANIDVLDALRVSASLIPSTDNTIDLGSATLQWRDLYVDGTANIDILSLDTSSGGGVNSNIKPLVNGSFNLGSASYQWNNIYIDGAALIDTLSLSTAAGEGVATHLNPSTDGTLHLGAASYRWNGVYGSFGSFVYSNDTTTTGMFYITRLAPTVNNDTLDTFRFTALTDAATIVNGFGGRIEYYLGDSGATQKVAQMEWERNGADDQCVIYFRLNSIGNNQVSQLTLHWDNYIESFTHLPFTADSWDLGATGSEWRDVYAQRLKLNQDAPRIEWREDGVAFNAGGLWRFVQDGGNIRFEENTAVAGDFSTNNYWILMEQTASRMQLGATTVPRVDLGYDLGSTSLAWNWVYTRNVQSPDYLFLNSIDGYTYIEGYQAVPSGTPAGSTYITSGGDGAWITSIQNGQGRVNVGWNNYFDGTDWRYWDTPDGASKLNVGVSGTSVSWSWLFTDTGAAAAGGIITWDSTYAFAISSAGAECKTFLPVADETYDLGSGTERWRDLYCRVVFATRSDTGLANIAADFEHNTISDTNSLAAIVRFDPTCDSTVVDGFGGYNDYRLDGTQVAQFRWVRDSANNKCDFYWVTHNGSSLLERFRMTHDNDIAFGGYVVPPTGVNSGYNVQMTTGAVNDYVWQVSMANGTNRVNETYNAYYDSGTWRYFRGTDEAFRRFITASGGGLGCEYLWGGGGTAGGAITWNTICKMNETNITYHTDLLPNADSTRDLGSASRYWALAYVDSVYIDPNFRLYLDGTPDSVIIFDASDQLRYDRSANQWYFSVGGTNSLLVGAGSITVIGDLKTLSGLSDIGSSSTPFDNIYGGTLDLEGGADGFGFRTHCKPYLDNNFDLGSSSYEWRNLYIDGTANIDRLTVATGTSLGCDDLDPYADEIDDLGSSTWAWDVAYIADIYSHQGLYSFDRYDDLALIEAYQPLAHAEPEIIERGGHSRSMQRADPSTLPWPMLGPRSPGRQTWFLSVSDSISFMLGGIKQLYQKHKAEVATLHQEIDDLKGELSSINARLEAIGA